MDGFEAHFWMTVAGRNRLGPRHSRNSMPENSMRTAPSGFSEALSGFMRRMNSAAQGLSGFPTRLCRTATRPASRHDLRHGSRHDPAAPRHDPPASRHVSPASRHVSLASRHASPASRHACPPPRHDPAAPRHAISRWPPPPGMRESKARSVIEWVRDRQRPMRGRTHWRGARGARLGAPGSTGPCKAPASPGDGATRCSSQTSFRGLG